MKSFSGGTGIVHQRDLVSDVRACFSATAARLKEDVWLRVETRWVADRTPLRVTIFLEQDEGNRETLKELDGQIAGNQWEQSWRIELPPERLDELHGAIQLRFEARLDGHPLAGTSQALVVHRTRFST